MLIVDDLEDNRNNIVAQERQWLKIVVTVINCLSKK